MKLVGLTMLLFLLQLMFRVLDMLHARLESVEIS
jgi:hypothetical protein